MVGGRTQRRPRCALKQCPLLRSLVTAAVTGLARMYYSFGQSIVVVCRSMKAEGGVPLARLCNLGNTDFTLRGGSCSHLPPSTHDHRTSHEVCSIPEWTGILNCGRRLRMAQRILESHPRASCTLACLGHKLFSWRRLDVTHDTGDRDLRQ